MNKNKTINIDLKTIAEAMVASYQWKNEHDHMERCAAYKLILSEADFQTVVGMCQMMVQQNNIKPQVK